MIIEQSKAGLLESAVEQISNGEIVEFTMKPSKEGLSIGDLRAVGWVERIIWEDGMQWHYLGPNRIKLGNQILESGAYSEEIQLRR